MMLRSSYGSLEFPKLTFSQGVNLRAGINKISLLSIAVGLPNVGPHFKTWNAGVLGPVTLEGINEGRRDLSWQKWSYKIGLKGEALNLHSASGSSSVEWAQRSFVTRRQPLTWYKTTFNAPAGNSPLALVMSNMGKGQIWMNGKSVGRHWPAYKASGNCGVCNYAETFNEKKCGTNCGEASQRWYHVPHSWLNPTGNLLVVFEESGGDPNGISLLCVGQNFCTVTVAPEMFGGDPCPSVMKKPSVEKIEEAMEAAHRDDCTPSPCAKCW
ncbi:hypothetical protein F3Y22_tig00111769pilonHSYRG00476 [Hibiscus syriacus]|uniref:SUEL-type lectin domain-containing protein n=1 Tax=Hibiscus syriacus TaxID=106335 RepID=A0A6A2Y9W7_HIBSY|nr:hypothetical protein F3Y22_tig00111769pilonHSYRG00476 [Hibiscus syriacus]